VRGGWRLAAVCCCVLGWAVLWAGAARARAAPPPHSPPRAPPPPRRRRALLVESIASLFKLAPPGASPGADPDAMAVDGGAGSHARGGGAGGVGDAIFLRIVELPKGRALLAKYFRAALPPAANGAALPPEQRREQGALAPGCEAVLLAVLRNAGRLFGPALAPPEAAAGAGGDSRMTDATARLAAATAELVRRLREPAALQRALGALAGACAAVAGAAGAAPAERLLPLFPANRVPSDANPDWLGSVAASLLLRGSELGLQPGAAAGDGAGAAMGLGPDESESEPVDAWVAQQWQQGAGAFAADVLQHLQLLLAMRAAEPGSKALVAALSCVPLVRGLVQHCSAEQGEQLKVVLHELAL
jgi:hypothetical protein